MVYVITAATSRTGRVAAETLLAQGHSVRAVVRSEEKGQHLKDLGAEIAIADLTDVNSLVAAFSGATAVYVMNPPDFSNDLFVKAKKIAEALLSAIQISKVGKVIALSSIGSELPTGTGNILCTNILEKSLSTASNTQVVFLRAGFFMENWKSAFGVAKESGTLTSAYAPLDKKLPMVATADIGVAIAKYLTSETDDKIINIAGPEESSVNDVAEAFTSTLGKTIRAVVVPDEQLQSHFNKFVPELAASAFVDMTRGFNTGRIVWEQGTKTYKGQVKVGQVVSAWL